MVLAEKPTAAWRTAVTSKAEVRNLFEDIIHGDLFTCFYCAKCHIAPARPASIGITRMINPTGRRLKKDILTINKRNALSFLVGKTFNSLFR